MTTPPAAAPLLAHLEEPPLPEEIQRGLEGHDPITAQRLKNIYFSIQRREAAEKARAAADPHPTPTPASKAKVVQLPLWPDPVRGVPNPLMRSALFAAVQGKQRRAMQRELLEVQQGTEIRFTGIQLDQSDLDVWEQALHLARLQPLGTRCHFVAHSFLKSLGRATGKANHEWLKDSIARLAACCVEVKYGRFTYGGSLLEFYRDDETGRYYLEINPKMKAIYDAGYTLTDWDERAELRGKPLALWLHGYFATHADPFPVKVETLHRLSGSANKDIYSFKQQLKAALADVQAIGAIEGYVIEGELVSVERTPTPSQQRHLSKPKPRRK
jgi:TrfA protein